MADSTAFNFGGVWTPTYDGEPGVQQYETVGQFDVRYWEEYNGGVAGGGQNTQASILTLIAILSIAVSFLTISAPI